MQEKSFKEGIYIQCKWPEPGMTVRELYELNNITDMKACAIYLAE